MLGRTSILILISLVFFAGCNQKSSNILARKGLYIYSVSDDPSNATLSQEELNMRAYKTRVGIDDGNLYERLIFMEAAVVIEARYRAGYYSSRYSNSPEGIQSLSLFMEEEANRYAQEKMKVWSEPRFFGHGLKVHGLLVLDWALHAKC